MDLLELSALLITGLWGWQLSVLWYRMIPALGIPLVVAIMWGVFNVPGDPSRSGKAPVPVPGMFRIVLELTVFSIAVIALYDMGYYSLSCVFTLMIIFHYSLSYERLKWLLSK